MLQCLCQTSRHEAPTPGKKKKVNELPGIIIPRNAEGEVHHSNKRNNTTQHQTRNRHTTDTNATTTATHSYAHPPTTHTNTSSSSDSKDPHPHQRITLDTTTYNDTNTDSITGSSTDDKAPRLNELIKFSDRPDSNEKTTKIG